MPRTQPGPSVIAPLPAPNGMRTTRGCADSSRQNAFVTETQRPQRLGFCPCGTCLRLFDGGPVLLTLTNRGFFADMARREGRVPPELWMGPCTYAQDRPEWVSDQSESDLSKPINPDASGDQ